VLSPPIATHDVVVGQLTENNVPPELRVAGAMLMGADQVHTPADEVPEMTIGSPLSSAPAATQVEVLWQLIDSRLPAPREMGVDHAHVVENVATE
jgi:hypothetical protein